jgi:hypothetical protein
VARLRDAQASTAKQVQQDTIARFQIRGKHSLYVLLIDNPLCPSVLIRGQRQFRRPGWLAGAALEQKPNKFLIAASVRTREMGAKASSISNCAKFCRSARVMRTRGLFACSRSRAESRIAALGVQTGLFFEPKLDDLCIARG